jgi:hypothetical protein
MRFKATEIVSLAVAALAFGASILSAFYTYTSRNRELDIKLVEIGIGILRADPKETGLTAARGWAVQVIEDNSKVKFSSADRETLLLRPLLFVAVNPSTGKNLEDLTPAELEQWRKQGTAPR